MNPSQAVDLASQHHYTIIVMFVIGYVLHAGLQIDAVARAKNNPVESRWAIVQQNFFRLAGRFFVSLMLFLFLWKNPSSFPKVLGYLGVSLSADAIAMLTLPISQPVAGMFGFFVDSLLTYVPVLKNQLPPIEFTQVETHVTEKQTVTTETHTSQTVIPPAPKEEPGAKPTD